MTTKRDLIIIILMVVIFVTYLSYYPTGYSISEYYKSEQKAERQKAMDALDKINKIRQDHDRDPLEWDEDLYKLAQFRALDMNTRKYFSHTTPEGKGINDFNEKYGINTYIGENIYLRSYFRSPPVVVLFSYGGSIHGWYNSPGHKRTMLSHQYSKAALAKSGTYYVFLATYDP